VTLQYVLPVTSPNSHLTQTSFTTVHTVHSICSPFTVVVNPLLTTIAHQIFSSDPAEPQLPPNRLLQRLHSAEKQTAIITQDL